MVEGCFVENLGIVVVGFCGHRNVLFMGRECACRASHICCACFLYVWIMLSGALYVPFKAYLGRFQAIYG